MFIPHIITELNNIANSFIPRLTRTNNATDSRTPIFPKNTEGISIVSKYTCQIAITTETLIVSPKAYKIRENYIHVSGYKTRLDLVSILRKREDQALI